MGVCQKPLSGGYAGGPFIAESDGLFVWKATISAAPIISFEGRQELAYKIAVDRTRDN